MASNQPSMNWDRYWRKDGSMYARLWDAIAHFYRTVIIDRAVDREGRRCFDAGATVLHAGSGSGATDIPLGSHVRFVAMDLSVEALRIYRLLHGDHAQLVLADLRAMPFGDSSVDGILSIGVIEHFERSDMQSVLREHSRVVRPGGRLLILWPPVWGVTVRLLAVAECAIGAIVRRSVRLHPPEPGLYRSRRETEAHVRGTGLEIVSSRFGWRDAFTHQFVVLRRLP